MRLPSFLLDYHARIIEDLERTLQDDACGPPLVQEAMRYTLLAPSKRIRATLALLAAELCGSSARAGPAAASVELVHAASLILDDLPCMDDAPLRRGQPANHVRFGEATAILASFGLLNLAFATLARAYDGPLA